LLTLSMQHSLRFALFAALSVCLAGSAAPMDITLRSPSETVQASIRMDDGGSLSYSVICKGSVVIEPSPLGITIDGVDLGKAVRAGTAKRGEILETFRVLGVHSVATNHCRTLALPLVHKSSGTEYQLELRAYEDGFAWRYRIPGIGPRTILGETSSWTLPSASRVWYAERDNSWKLKSYAGEWLVADIDAMPKVSSQGPVQGPPLVAELPGGLFAVLTEAAVFNYSGLRLRAIGGRRFQADFTEAGIGFRLEGEIVTPWRVVVIAPDLNRLVNTDTITSLCPAPDEGLFPNQSWIKPGRCGWRWWSLGTGDPDQERAVVDAAARLGFEYSLVDEGWEAWNDPFEKVRELCAHGRQKGVGVFVWKNYSELRNPAEDWKEMRGFMARAKASGAAGVKVDFLNAESLDRIRFEEAALRIAATNRMLVNFHGCQKPGGESRTYPNKITCEAVRGLELNKMKEGPIMARHNAALPFTRFVAGPADYTPVGFSNPGPTTFAHQLATLVLFTSPMQVIAENPDLLLNDTKLLPALDVLKAVPAVWDETRVLEPSKIGRLAIMARRSGATWFLAALNGGKQTVTLDKLDLSFLGKDSYDAIYLSSDGPSQFARKERHAVEASTPLSISLDVGDGFVARFERRIDKGR
jgi:alpha-glucosidase